MSFRLDLHGLAAKLSLTFSLVVAASAAILALSSYVDESVVLRREAQARYDSIATNLAFNAEYGCLTRNEMALEQLLKGVMREEDVNFAEIDDMGGASLAREGERKEPAALVSRPVFLQKVQSTDSVEYLFGEEEKPRLGKGSEESERIGNVLVEFNTTFIRQKLASMQKRAVAVSVLTIFFGVILSGILSRLLTAPLQDLAHATSRVASGDLEHVVKSKSRDEIGELAAAFNTMTANLKTSTVSRDYLDALLDSIPDAIIVVGVGGTIKTVNKGALRLSGFSEADLLGAPLEKLLTSDGGWILAKEGESVPVSVSTGELGGGGRSLGVVHVAHDVRPMQKLQERLLQTEKMAAVGQLAAGVSHEINNPLGVILGFAQGLCRRLEAGHPLEVPLRSIEREAMRCKDLVQDLLTFSRASHVEREPIDLNAAVEGALSLIQAQARMDRAEVRQVLAPSLPKVYGSRNQIQQVVINLAKNALDAMPQGGAVTVITELEEGLRSWVRLRVQDQGTGIPPEILPRIFEPFFTTKPVGRGTGLGLSLVYEIVKKHSGTLDVKSRPGATEFVIRFPVRTGREADGGRIASASHPGEKAA